MCIALDYPIPGIPLPQVSTISATSSVHQPQPPGSYIPMQIELDLERDRTLVYLSVLTDGPKPSTQGYRARKSKVGEWRFHMMPGMVDLQCLGA